jgi:Ca2+-binding RTX toxin-like protein
MTPSMLAQADTVEGEDGDDSLLGGADNDVLRVATTTIWSMAV